MSWEIRQGDALEQLREMSAGSVQCCVTSPPFFGLRDYGTGRWEGGAADCDHIKGEMRHGINLAASVHSTRGGAKKAAQVPDIPYGPICGKCGARRVDQQIGLEASPDEFISRLVEVFREVRRVLRDDGTLWLNIGDSYASGGRDSYCSDRINLAREHNSRPDTPAMCKPKDLLMVPAQLALALRADGWYLRSEIVWSKPNPMPESVTDRPTSAHEKLFLLAKSPRYYFDADAIREPVSPLSAAVHSRYKGGGSALGPKAASLPGRGECDSNSKLRNGKDRDLSAGRNKRNVWEIATHPYPDAHFATFAPKLVEPCILAGSSPRACGVCGAPWRRLTQSERSAKEAFIERQRNVGGRTDGFTRPKSSGGLPPVERETVGWKAGCYHADRPAPDDTGRSVILDPFAGAGTTGLVALRHDRSFVGIELNASYAEMARQRIRDDAPLLNAASETSATEASQP